jgi:hypothetical protein
MTFIQKINHRFPALGKKFSVFSRKKKTSVWQDMLLCTAVTLSSAFYEYEASLPGIVGEVIRTILLVLMVVCWVWCSFLNGFWKKHSFLVFAAAFWLIPRLIMLARANMSILNYNSFLDAAAQYSTLIVEVSLRRFANLSGTTELITAIILIAWCLCFFGGGKAFGKAIKQW